MGAESTAGRHGEGTGAVGGGTDSGNGLYERESELAALSGALSAARSGAGGLVVVEGPAGIGKSRLLAEAGAMAEARGMTVLTARAIDLERDVSFGIVSDLFAPILAAGAGSSLLSGAAALAAALFDPAARPEADPSALIRGLYWLTANVAAPAGLLITVDDAQWADRPSLAYLVHLSARIGELPVVLVIAVRSGEQATDRQAVDWLEDRSGSGLLRPRALSADAIGRMVRAELPATEPAFTAACAEVTGGNPFLARELLHALRDESVAPTADSVGRVRSLVPDSVLRAVLARLARLGESAETLARAVAVLGGRAPLRQARVLAGLEAIAAEQAADLLAGASILAAGWPLRFTHPLIAASIYSDIPAFARARAHRQAADLLSGDGASPDAAAGHLLLTRPDADQRTVAALREAAARALTRGDPGAAGHLLGRALDEPPATAERGQVLLELANAEIARGDMAARSHIDEAISLASAPDESARALAGLGRLHFHRGEHEAAARAIEDALALLEPESPELPALLVGYLTATTFRAGLYPNATGRLQPVIEAARAGRPPRDPGLLAHLVVRLTFAAEPVTWIRALAERATAADPLVDSEGMGILNGLIVQALCCLDELDEAERVSGLAVAAGCRHGSLLTYSTGSYHRAIPRYHRGELASALADLEQSLTASREGWTAGDPWIGSLLAHTHLERGDLVAAREALAMTAVAPPGSMDIPVIAHARARLALAEGRPDAALSDAVAAGRLLRDGFGIDHPGFVPWQWTASLAARALGDADRARAWADELLDRARWSGTARAIGLALRTQAAVSGADRREQRRRLLAEAADVLAGSPSALQRAHVLVELGTACLRTGARASAEQPLRDGLALADRMGAWPLVHAARRELRGLGLRPRRLAVTGPDALTPTERRVAELAASGLTNRQTAEALFVTVKTVETHMARVFQKLGISKRPALADIIGARGEHPAMW